ncbi:hypothetical protein [Streptomyces sp. AP-93]|uniref:hypothetical protein n=1 Tax=Streptomyces sp. AP-93 TaxID=2929048 RepID=UPI001FAF70DE|nr:hypothetical protein [Streptomyces sp. AP-93]MCJ0871522.1 hypothetical protein [Streptomyces sp. AP-93]
MTRMAYGDSLAAGTRVDGDFPVVGSGGISGSHSSSNFRAPGIVVGRKGSYGSVHWLPSGGFAIDTAYYIDERLTSANLRWLYYVLQAVDLKGPSQDVGVPGLAREAAYEVSVPAPPSLDEQRCIADFLDAETARIDQLTALRSRQSELLGDHWRSEVSAVLLDLTTRYGDVRIRHLLMGMEQGWSPQCEDRLVENGEWGVVKAGCVNSGKFDASQHKALPAGVEPRREFAIKQGDLLMSRASGSTKLIGSVGIVGELRSNLLLCDKVYRLQINRTRAHVDFVAHTLRSHQVRMHLENGISGAEGMANSLPSSVVKDCVIPDVPVGKQSAIASALDRSAESVARARKALAASVGLLAERRQALITAAVTGQFDVSTASGRNVTDGVTT